jgi:hypothetical protein
MLRSERSFGLPYMPNVLALVLGKGSLRLR